MSRQLHPTPAIRDNLFGLEIDPRCTQLAAFAVALAAWERDGYRPLPIPNIACSGLALKGQIEEMDEARGRRREPPPHPGKAILPLLGLHQT